MLDFCCYAFRYFINELLFCGVDLRVSKSGYGEKGVDNGFLDSSYLGDM